MTTPLAELTDLYSAQFQIAVLVLVRIAAMMAPVPIVGSMSVPFQVRAGLALAVTIVVFPSIPQSTVHLPRDGSEFFLLVFREVIAGLVIGWVFGLVFQVVEIAGAVIDAVAGYAMVELFDPITGQTSHLFGQFLIAVASVGFLVSGAMSRMVAVIAGSFQALPLDAASLRAGSLIGHVARLTSISFQTGIQLAGPVLMSLLMVTLVMAVVSRVMPAMNAWMLAMPLQIVVACAVTAIGLPWMMHVFHIWEAQVFQAVDGLLQAMG